MTIPVPPVRRLSLTIASTWDGGQIDPSEQSRIDLQADDDALAVSFEAPFHNDPAPPGAAGMLDGLWRFEVVELFLAEAHARAESVRYTELEVSPHGHSLLLLFAGVRRRVAAVPVTARSRIIGDRWTARLRMPWSAVPAGDLVANAYAIHGAGAGRRFLAMHPLPGSRPDFHQPARFPAIALRRGDKSRLALSWS